MKNIFLLKHSSPQQHARKHKCAHTHARTKLVKYVAKTKVTGKFHKLYQIMTLLIYYNNLITHTATVKCLIVYCHGSV